MRTRFAVTLGTAAVAVMTGLGGLNHPTHASAKTRIGVFDSRMVALAYYNTDEQRTTLRRMMVDLQEAKAAGNQAKVKELEFQGPAVQSLMHYQVFSTASIPNVMETMGPALVKVAQQADVALIVSKWEVSYRRDDVEYVDVTDDLVRTFNPNAQVQKWIAEGSKQPPVPLLQLVKTMRADQ